MMCACVIFSMFDVVKPDNLIIQCIKLTLFLLLIHYDCFDFEWDITYCSQCSFVILRY